MNNVNDKNNITRTNINKNNFNEVNSNKNHNYKDDDNNINCSDKAHNSENTIFTNRTCDICGRPAKNYMFGCFICDNEICLKKARLLRGSPAGHNIKVVAVGSKNPSKIKAVEDALSKTMGTALVKAVDVDSEVSNQPIGLNETAKGAINRAKKAFESGQFLYGIGIEAGLVSLFNKYLDIHVCAVYDGMNYTLGTSQGFQIPCEVVEGIKNGSECGHVAEKLYGIKNIGMKEGIIGYLTNNNIKRVDLCIDAVVSAIIPRLKCNQNIKF